MWHEGGIREALARIATATARSFAPTHLQGAAWQQRHQAAC